MVFNIGVIVKVLVVIEILGVDVVDGFVIMVFIMSVMIRVSMSCNVVENCILW